jgi:glycosyltransferase involved in cell wall biosynthesis
VIRIIYREEEDRWIKGDRHIRPIVRRLFRGIPERRSGMQKVVDNFLLGLQRLNVPYGFNDIPLFIKPSEKIISFGLGKPGVQGVKKTNPLIAAIGFPYPADFSELCEEYNVKKFLQHSDWVLSLSRSAGIYPNELFDTWPAGIDTMEWAPLENKSKKNIDFLIYNKIHWQKDEYEISLTGPLKNHLRSKGYSYKEIAYGNYLPAGYKSLLHESKAMIFLSAHESQGIAYQEALSTGVPVLAWDQGYWLDPVRFEYNRPIVKATSVPFFDERCGNTFVDIEDFKKKIDAFFGSLTEGTFSPREYILENLTIEKSTQQMLDHYNSI